MIKKIIRANNGILKLIIEFIVLIIFVWTFIQVRDIPGTYTTKAEANQIKIEVKTDIDRAVEPMREQIQQIYNHLLSDEKKVMMKIKTYIQQNEGLRLKPYKCSADKLTIGYGRNLEDVGISKGEAEDMLMNDICRCSIEAASIFGIEFYFMQHNVKIVIIDMLFNLGKPRFEGFEQMIKAIKNKNFDLAAKELLDSHYARRLSNRANKNADLMRRK